jgi:hypothetical protein
MAPGKKKSVPLKKRKTVSAKKKKIISSRKKKSTSFKKKKAIPAKKLAKKKKLVSVKVTPRGKRKKNAKHVAASKKKTKIPAGKSKKNSSTKKNESALVLRGAVNLPFNEVNIRYKDVAKKTNFIYGLTVHLTQNDLPYDPKTGISENAHFVICADTIYIDSSLINPGYDISICARLILIMEPVCIITTPLLPANNYKPGDKAQLTNGAPGTHGSDGKDGDNGLNAGNISIATENFWIPGSGSAIASKLDLNMRNVLYTLFENNFKKIFQGQSAVPDKKIPNVFLFNMNVAFSSKQADLDLSGTTISKIEFPNFTGGYDPHTENCWLEVVLKVFVNTNIRITSMYGTTAVFDAKAVMTGQFEIVVNQEYNVNLIKKDFSKKGTVRLKITRPAFNVRWIKEPMFIASEFDNAYFVRLTENQLMNHVTDSLKIKIQNTVTPEENPFRSNFQLHLITSGGMGGRGQDGSDGFAGKNGRDGVKDTRDRNLMNGERGGYGGNGGSAGKSGKGGKPGAISVKIINDQSRIWIAGMNEGGPGGRSAEPGLPGAAGTAGRAGNFLDYSKARPPLHMPINFQGEPGHFGMAGLRAKYVGQNGETGPHFGKYWAVDSGVGYDSVAAFMFSENLLLTQRAAEFSYLSAVKKDDFRYPVTLAMWLYNITTGILRKQIVAPQWNEQGLATAKGVNDFSKTMLDYYQRGLDFYGHYPNWAPILSLESYQRRIDQLIPLGKIIEDQFRKYQDDKTKSDERLAIIGTVKTKLLADIRNDNDEIDELQSQIELTLTLIVNLNIILQEQQAYVFRTEQIFTAEFKKYISIKSSCKFKDIIEAVSTIVKMGSAVYGNVQNIAIFADKFETITSTTDNIINSIKIIQQVKTGFDSLKEGWEKLTKVLDGDKKAVGLMMAKREEFDEMIKDLLGEFKAADELKSAVDDMFDIIDKRNQTICTYNSHFVSKAKLQAQVIQKSAQLSEVTVLLKQQNPDPALPSFTSFMQHSYNTIKTTLVRKLYEENRAFAYWSLQESPFSTSDMNMATLSDTHSRLSEKIDLYKERKGGPFQPFTQQIEIKAEDWELAFRTFPETRKISFTFDLSMKEFRNQFQVMASKVAIEFPDVKSENDVFSLRLVHSGHSFQRADSKSEPVEFSHLPRTVPYKIDFKNPKNTGGGLIGDNEAKGAKQGYSGLSPFTLWTLDFSLLSDNEFKVLANMTRFVLTFEGTYTSPLLMNKFRKEIAEKKLNRKKVKN